MWRLAARSIILTMTSRRTPSRLVLVADLRNGVGDDAAVPIRRFRIARLRLDARPLTGADRFAHLKRVYD
jgi:hypothetical protein